MRTEISARSVRANALLAAGALLLAGVTPLAHSADTVTGSADVALTSGVLADVGGLLADLAPTHALDAGALAASGGSFDLSVLFAQELAAAAGAVTPLFILPSTLGGVTSTGIAEALSDLLSLQLGGAFSSLADVVGSDLVLLGEDLVVNPVVALAEMLVVAPAEFLFGADVVPAVAADLAASLIP